MNVDISIVDELLVSCMHAASPEDTKAANFLAVFSDLAIGILV